MVSKAKLKVGDQVRVVSGRSKGRDGRILRLDPKGKRVWVEGANIVKKTVRPTNQNQKGGITDVEASLSWANVMVICKKCGISRIRIRVSQKEKSRVCAKCGEQL